MLALMLPAWLMAQKVINGRVTEAGTSNPLSGASVSEKGTTINTQTDADGKHKSQIWYDYMGLLIKGDKKQQPSFRPFIEPFLEQIEFGDDLLAKRFYPLGKEKNVVVDPTRQFGKPVIKGKSIRTDVIYRFYLGGETKENICKLYELTDLQVTDAIFYHEQAA